MWIVRRRAGKSRRAPGRQEGALLSATGEDVRRIARRAMTSVIVTVQYKQSDRNEGCCGQHRADQGANAVPVPIATPIIESA